MRKRITVRGQGYLQGTRLARKGKVEESVKRMNGHGVE